MNRKISVSDVTIKLSGAALPFRKKLELSKMLDSLGVGAIELGPVEKGREDILLVKSISAAVREAVIAIPARKDTLEESWEALKDARSPRLQFCAPLSAVQMEYLFHKKPAAMLDLIRETVSSAKELCSEVEFIAEDFGRAESEFLAQALEAASESGATLVTLRDTAGNLLPEEFAGKIAGIKAMLPDGVKLGVWCSNEMFLADSCAVAAVVAGADEIKVSACDNSAVSLKRFASIVKAREDACRAHTGIKTTEIQRQVERMKILCEFDRKKPLASLEGLSAENASSIPLSIHDSRETIVKTALSLGYDLEDEDAANVYEAFIRIASKNETVSVKELEAIIASVAFQAPAAYSLDSYLVTSGNTISSTCHLRLKKGEDILESVCVGDGPVDAAFEAIEKLVDRQYELDDFQIQSVTEGREAMGEAVVRLRYDGRVFSGRGISTDIVGSSIMAYLSAVNKIVYEEQQ